VRLWSIHPKYLDPAGLVALWREGLLAQAVLAGRTRGYTRHPQLERFRAQEEPQMAIASYLHAVADEARKRGYAFDVTKLPPRVETAPMTVSRQQLRYEWEHLREKLRNRDPFWCEAAASVKSPRPHPSFIVVPGPIASWERTGDRA
jgi:Pyrimidine dimer DNA glycosylase